MLIFISTAHTQW